MSNQQFGCLLDGRRTDGAPRRFLPGNSRGVREHGAVALLARV
jgi:hypothetical protein